MRSSLDWKTIGGTLALLVTLLLALPGVKAVRAEDQQAGASSSDGAQCNPVGPEAGIAQAGPSTAELQARIAARIAAAQGNPSGDAPILLNNRGYNYATGSDLDRITAEAIRTPAQR